MTPGLIDLHTHMSDKQLPPSTVLADGVTSLLDAGSAGFDNIDDLVKIVQAAPNRVRILINIGHLGVAPEGELNNLDNVNPEATRKAIERNRQWVVGIKARLSRTVAGDHDLEALRPRAPGGGSLEGADHDPCRPDFLAATGDPRAAQAG